MRWTPWKNVERPADHRGPAVYRIRLARRRRALAVARFLDTDASGLLALGSTADMEARRRDFLTGLRRCSRNPEGSLLHLIEVHSLFHQKYRGCEYEYSFCKTATRFDARVAERKLHKTYFKTFGEVPPMNAALPGRRDAGGW